MTTYGGIRMNLTSQKYWNNFIERGYTLNCPTSEVLNIITPTGFSTQIRLKRLASYCRYVR